MYKYTGERALSIKLIDSKTKDIKWVTFQSGALVPEEYVALVKCHDETIYCIAPHIEEPIKELIEEPIVEAEPEPFYDDYLNRSLNVVLKSLRQDSFSANQINGLLIYEMQHKNRKKIVDWLEEHSI